MFEMTMSLYPDDTLRTNSALYACSLCPPPPPWKCPPADEEEFAI